MKILILDTSTEQPIVVISEGFEFRFAQALPVGFKSSTHLFDSISLGYQEVGFDTSSLDAIAVTTGPGLFTGIRVAAAAAKGLALPSSLPLIGLCSLSGFVSPELGNFASVIDARIGGAYVLFQKREHEKIRELGEPRLVPKEVLSATLEGWLSVGPSLSRLGLEKTYECAPDPQHLTELAAKKFLAKEYSADLSLSYLRSGVER